MTATWPAELPQKLEQEGFKETPPNLLLRTEMDAGPAKVRRRHRAGVRPVSGVLVLTDAQVETLDEFYETTLEGGALQFGWVVPRTGAACQMRFVSQPSYAALGGTYYKATVQLEIMP